MMSAIRTGICGLLAFAALAAGGVPAWGTGGLEIGASGLLFLWGVASIREQRAEIHGNWLYVPVLGFMAFCFTQKLFGLSAYSYATKMELLKWISYFVISFLAVETFRTTAQLKGIAIFLISLGFAVALFGIVQRLTFNGKLYWFVLLPHPSEPFGPFVDRDHFAGFVELTAPIGLAMLLHGTWRGEKAALLGLFTAVPIAALVMSGSRGGIAGFGFAIVVLAFASPWREIRIRRLLAFAALVVFAGTLMLWLGTNATIQRFEKLTASNISRDQRLSMDRDTWKVFAGHPWAGTGLGTLETVFPQYESIYDARSVDHAHNDYVELLAETGTIGGILGLAFVALLLRQGITHLRLCEDPFNRAFHAGALAACCALLMHSFVDFNLHVPANALAFLLLAALVSAEMDEAQMAARG